MRELSKMMKIFFILKEGWVIQAYIFVHFSSIYFMTHNYSLMMTGMKNHKERQLYPMRLIKIHKFDNTLFSQGCGEQILSYTVAENINANRYNSLRWGIWKYLESIHMYLHFDTASLPLRFYSKSILSKYKMTDE